MTSHYFVGIPVDPSLVPLFSKWQASLKEHMDYKVWTHPEDFHITLKFLGPSSEDQLQSLLNNLNEVDWPEAFSLSAGPAGYFGNPRNPRVFHVEVSLPSALEKIQNLVEQAGKKAGYSLENRKYSPHITLAKKWRSGQSPLIDHPDKFEETIEMDVHRFFVYQILPKETPKYHKVAEYELKKGKP
ncbi:RNA 2',3'-cyclic phosphodiesterase [Halobacillus sp. Marseille-Q1614]|uniref:RNA 2',3'-cyclic phosphodiesterase n=1 Tax=Halobacillus sp. Marseille-Q1614 TaxID=2709134 RepID=UPI00157039DD|nr:RNA 2',3'-cyclic phosphodiesterase [Halobacillus sp. Marseille-Q1614]